MDGTWGGAEPVPAEYVHFSLMKQMGWSWQQLRATPTYVVQYVYDCLVLVSQHEAAEADKAAAEARR